MHSIGQTIRDENVELTLTDQAIWELKFRYGLRADQLENALNRLVVNQEDGPKWHDKDRNLVDASNIETAGFYIRSLTSVPNKYNHESTIISVELVDASTPDNAIALLEYLTQQDLVNQGALDLLRKMAHDPEMRIC